MANGKYLRWIQPDGLLMICAWTRDGMTDEQIAKKMDISTSTLYEWKKKYPEISEALKKNKAIVDVEAENALYKRALGEKKIIKKPIKVKEILYKDGKRVSEKEKVKYVQETVYIPPDVTALIFWLKNRKPEVWRDKPTPDDSEMKERLETVLEGIDAIANS